jgi:hypothetical protein
LRDGSDLLLDPEGRYLDGLAAVASEALREARALVSAEALGGSIKFDQRIDVEDERGAMVHRLDFANAVKITGVSTAAS